MSLVGFSARNHPQQRIRDDVDDRGTAPEHFAAFNEQLGPFTLDVAAAAHNTKCARYFTTADDGLHQSWAGERIWCNPPYSNIGPWLSKAWEEHTSTNGIAMLLPANRSEQAWWQRHVEPHRDRAGSPLCVTFLPGRMRFIKHDQGASTIGPNERPPFGCCLLTWGLGRFDPHQQNGGLW